MTPKKPTDAATDTEATPVVAAPVLETFFFPTLGNGVSIQAASKEEAEEKIRKHPLHPDNLNSPNKDGQ